MATTLVDYWTAEVARQTTAQTTAQSALTTALANEAAAQTAFVAASSAVTAARAAVDSIRKQLGSIALPGDGGPLLTDMRAALVTLRVAMADSVQKENDVRQKTAYRTYWNSKVTTVATNLAAAQKQLAIEQKNALQRQAWITAATTSPIQDLPTQASTALTQFEANAKSKVEGDFPNNADPSKDFLTQVRARRGLAASVVSTASGIASAAQAVNTAWDESSTRQADKTPALQRSFDATATALLSFVQSGNSVNQTIAALQALANRNTSPLTTAERADLITSDATLQGQRETALADLKTRDDAQAALFAAQALYAEALFAAQAANPDATEAQLLAADATLQGKHDDITAKAGTLTSAENTVTPELPLLQDWFVAVPDALWDQLDTLDAATATLNTVQAIVPATLVSNLSSAENALATHLDAVSKEVREEAVMADGLAAAQGNAAMATDLDQRRQLAASRFVAEI